MSAVPAVAEEYCPSCGEWVFYLAFDYETGWCSSCSGSASSEPRCTRCGGELKPEHGRTTCHACRLEGWYERHADEIEFLMVVKGYTLPQARSAITRMIRPICQCCNRPIKGGKEGDLFHKGGDHKRCRQAATKYRSLVKLGLPIGEALATIRAAYQGR